MTGLFARWFGVRRNASAPLPPVTTVSQPALVMDAGGGLLVANAAAQRFAHALLYGNLPEAREQIRRAARDGDGTWGRAVFDADGQTIECDFDAIPLGADRALVIARHGGLEQNLREALVDSRRRYKDLVEVSSDFAWETDADGKFVFVSPTGALGWCADDLIGHGAASFVAQPGDGDGPSDPFGARSAISDGEVWFRRAGGGTACLSISARPLYDEQGRWTGARGICRDVSEDRERDAQLARAHARERLFGYIVRTMRDEVEPANMLAAAATAIARAVTARGTEIHRLGEDGPVMAARYGDASPLASAGCIAACLRRPGAVGLTGDGAAVMAVAMRYQGAVNGALFLWRDIDLGVFSDDERETVVEAAEHLGIALEQIAAHEQLKELSSTDSLTGLLNRRSFMTDLARRFERAGRNGGAGALVYCDLDNFKQVNDTHGHDRGDAAIIETAAILLGATRGEDLVARLGGDEFALWLEGVNETTVRDRADELLRRAEVLTAYSGGKDTPLGMSLGIAVAAPGAGETLEQLMARADAAMYVSKKQGKSRCTVAPMPADAPRRVGEGA